MPCAAVAAPAPNFAPPNDEPAPTNPYAQLDPDGVPLAVTQSSRHPLTTEQIDALRKAAEQEVRDRNWLMLEYEHQQESHTSADGSDRPNIYLELSMDKNLAELAGLDHLTPDSSTPAPELHATPTLSSSAGAALRPASSDPTPGFSPALTPLSSAGTEVMQNFNIAPSIFSSDRNDTGITGTGPFTPSATDAATTAPSPAHSQAYMEATTDVQTPGMIAAKNDTLGDAGPPDLTLDALPNETEEAAREQAASTPAELPQVMSADTLHELQDAKLASPTLAAQTKLPPSVELAKKADAQKALLVPVNPDNAPLDVTKQPLLNPVHPSLGSPLDVLRR